jgi:hypothetical protein
LAVARAGHYGEVTSLAGALTELRDAVAEARYPLTVPGADEAARAAAATVNQLDDYLLPRLGRLDAPLLVVVGGSTGAGKSTLVNSLIREPVSPAGVLRPTTRSPLLVCHPDDAAWFTGAHLLPGLRRTSQAGTGADTLQVVTAAALTPGLALLDAPDIDSVVARNRALAAQLLAAADLWLFVTTAARYADAVPWELLSTAQARGTAVALVLDRMPDGAEPEITAHLAEMLTEHGLGEVPVFVVAEQPLGAQGLLDPAAVEPVRQWLRALAGSAAARAAVVRQTVDGAVVALGPTVATLAVAADGQVAAARALSTSVQTSHDAAGAAIERGVRDGGLLRGEVLARWQELVGTGELMRGLQAWVSRMRDRMLAAVTGRPGTGERLQAALGSGLVTLVQGALADAAEQTESGWRAHPAGQTLLATVERRSAADAALAERIERLARDWQRAVLDLVRAEAGNKRYVARVSAYAVNALGLVVMFTVFAATAFIPTGAEVVVAGGTTIAAQKVLEAIFGDQAVRELADRAREDLLRRVRALLAVEAGRFTRALDAAGVEPGLGDRLRRADAQVRRARAATPILADASGGHGAG